MKMKKIPPKTWKLLILSGKMGEGEEIGLSLQ